MKVLVIGQGGREHAIVRALSTSASVTKVYALPGSDGMSLQAECLNIDWKATDKVLGWLQENSVSLVVVGPEQPLAAGLADELRNNGFDVFGPNQSAARLESSKIFAKNFMIEAGIPTASFQIVESLEETMEKAKSYPAPYVLKADGLAAGKGVFICEDEAELKKAAQAMFVDKRFGRSGEKAMLENFQSGYELSYFVLTNGSGFQAMPLAQDHKRIGEGDKGLNTGGMGAVAPAPIDRILEAQIQEQVVQPLIEALNKGEYVYRGVIFIGLMITDGGPKVIEFNVRFGDPECQVLLPLLDGDWGEVMSRVASGEVPELSWKEMSSACVVLAAEGYPEKAVTGVKIEGDLRAEIDGGYFLHAGTQKADGHWLTAGGRVLNSVAMGDSLADALNKCYKQARNVNWPGCQYRKDIGHKLLGK